MVEKDELKEGEYYIYNSRFVRFIIENNKDNSFLFYFMDNTTMDHFHNGAVYSNNKSLKIIKRLGLDIKEGHCLWLKNLSDIILSSEEEYQLHIMLD